MGKEVQGKGLFAAAASYLGLMHMRGEGVPQSFDKAKIWFTRGVDLVLPLNWQWPTFFYQKHVLMD